MTHRTALFGLALTSGLVMSACSISTGKTPASSAEDLIEGELGEQVSLTFTEADCEAPADNEVGTTFECTALISDGAIVTFAGVIDPDDMIFVAPSNIVVAEEMAVVEQESAAVLGPEVGVEIDPADIDCPDETTVLDDGVLRCEITDAATGERYELTATLGDFVLREGYQDRFYAIGDLIET